MIFFNDRKLLEITGEDRLSFLQGLITNDIYKLSENNAIFTAFLTPQGKFLADFFIYMDGERLIIDICEKFIADLLKKLKIYKLRSKVEIAEISGRVFLSPSVGECSNDRGLVFKDPRSGIFGNRIILFSDENIIAEDIIEYHKLRIKNHIADGAYDLTIDKSFILEFGYDKLNAVDFEKGCYIGQEVTTRTYRRGVIRKEVRGFETEELYNIGDKITIDQKNGIICYITEIGDNNIIGMSLLRNR